MKNAIALTGGIATGKSTVSSIIKLYGYPIIDADKISHSLLTTDIVRDNFGDSFIVDNSIDRANFGKFIFSNPDAKKRLETILHPLIRDEISREAELLDNKNIIYLIDIPLFFETKAYEIKDVVCVYTPFEIQLERLIKRDNISRDFAITKIRNQMDIDEKKRLSNFVIDNSKDLKHLQKEVINFIETVLKNR